MQAQSALHVRKRARCLRSNSQTYTCAAQKIKARLTPSGWRVAESLGDVGNVRIPGLPDSLFLCTEVPGRLRPDTPETSLGCVAWMFPIADFFADLGSMTDMGHGQFCHLQIWQRSVQPLLCFGVPIFRDVASVSTQQIQASSFNALKCLKPSTYRGPHLIHGRSQDWSQYSACCFNITFWARVR